MNHCEDGSLAQALAHVVFDLGVSREDLCLCLVARATVFFYSFSFIT